MLMDKEELTQVGMHNVVSDGMHVLTSLALMSSCEALWRELDKRSTADLVWFQSFEWCNNWISQQGGTYAPHVLMLIENKSAVAVLPLMVSRNRLGVRLLHMLGDPHTQYGNILTTTGTLSAKQVQAFETALASVKGCDSLLCNYVPAGSPLDRVLGAAQRMTRLDNQSLAIDLVPFSTAAAYDASLSKNTSKNLRRRRKHLEDRGALRFDVIHPSDQGYDQAIEACFAMKQQWVAETGRIGLGLQHAGHALSLKGMRQASDSDDGPLAFVLSVAGKAVAIELGFLQRRHYYSYMGAFDWDLRQQAPGRLQMHEAICWLIGQGAQSMDLLANPTDYKRDAAGRSVALASFAKSYTMRGAVYASLWAGWGKPQLKRAIASIPERWRAGFNHVRKLQVSN